MRTYARVGALTVGLALLLWMGFSPSALAPSHQPPPPPPPPCEVQSVSIQGPSEGTVGESHTFKGEAQTQNCSSKPKYTWTLRSAPQGAEPWSASGQQVSFIPKVAGEHVLKLEVTVDNIGQGSAEHKLTVVARSSPAPQPPSVIQEYALILGIGSDNQLRTFPGKLIVSAGGLRLFLASLDRTVTIVIRRQGAQAGVATVLVEPSKLATVEVELAQGIYDILDQGTNSPLGQIEAR